ncbi:phage tail tape measure protein [Streptomyces sp. T1317-0309]|nr:phage tail tape measure protein [Streptomyces sp. T1317-0309]
MSGVSSVITFITQLPGLIVSGLSSLGSLLASFFSGLFTTVGTYLTTGFQAVVGFFTQLPGLILAGLQALPGLLINAFTTAIAAVGIAILTAIAAIVFIFTELPGRIASALVSLGSTIITRSPRGSARRPRRSARSSLAASFFAQLPGRIASALAALPGRVSSLFRSAGSSALGAAQSFGSSVTGFFSALPGRIASALSSVGSRIAGVFRSAAGSARSAVSSLISGIVSLFSGLGSRIVGALGNIGGQIVSKIKSGLPSAVRKYLPFAEGGIVYGPTHALVGEAGPEVIIPLTKPQRARQLAARSGLLDILGDAKKGGSSSAPAGPVIHQTFHITEVGNARTTAHRVSTRLALEAGVI